MGWITTDEAQARIMLTLQSLSGTTPGFTLPRNKRGFTCTFIDSFTGKVWGNESGTQQFALMSTDLMHAGILFVKTYFERTDPGSANTLEISKLASALFTSVQWSSLLCGSNGQLDPNGTDIPMLVDWADGCSAPCCPLHPDGYYEFNEEFIAVYFAWQTACGDHPPGECPNKGIERMWQRWQGRRTNPLYKYETHPLLSLWASYVVHLPFYMVHAFNSDKAYTELFKSHWQAEWAFYNGSEFYGGDDGRYGLGAGPLDPSCAGGRVYATDFFYTIGFDYYPHDHCRMYSPYAVAGYLPANPSVIQPQILALLASGEAVYPLPKGEAVYPLSNNASGYTSPVDTNTAGHTSTTSTGYGGPSGGAVEAASDEAYFVLWRKSLLHPGWSSDPPDAYTGVTMVDVASELFGLSTVWLGAGFYRNNTDHWPSQADSTDHWPS
jgi:hypothetical protein